VAPIQIVYVAKIDVLYVRFDDQKQEVINKRLSEDVVLHVGKGENPR
jgi:hypothetical protein